MVMARKEVLVQLDDELVAQLDALAQAFGATQWHSTSICVARADSADA